MTTGTPCTRWCTPVQPGNPTSDLTITQYPNGTPTTLGGGQSRKVNIFQHTPSITIPRIVIALTLATASQSPPLDPSLQVYPVIYPQSLSFVFSASCCWYRMSLVHFPFNVIRTKNTWDPLKAHLVILVTIHFLDTHLVALMVGNTCMVSFQMTPRAVIKSSRHIGALWHPMRSLSH